MGSKKTFKCRISNLHCTICPGWFVHLFIRCWSRFAIDPERTGQYMYLLIAAR